MAADPEHTQVLVVGAGPVGLLLACELALAGTRVTVWEDLAAPSTASRASTLHARTMEILDARGLLAPLADAPREPRGHFGGIPMDLAGDSPLAGQWKVAQARTEELLAARARELGVRVHRGHRLTAYHTHPDTEAGPDTEADAEAGAGGWVEARARTARGERRLRASYLVACDGQDSTVRALAGGAFPGHPPRRELLRADVSGISIPDRRFQRLPGGLAIAARREGVTRVMVHAFGQLAPARTREVGFPEIAQVWKQVTGEDIQGGTPLWANSFGDANRQLEHYISGRVLFAGDAAHQQMPIGGQALNLGLQDAFNLGWKLAAHLRGDAPAGLLASYHRERHAVGARVLANIEAQATLLLGEPAIDPLREVWAELLALDSVRGHLAGMISGLDIRYPPPPHLPAQAEGRGGAGQAHPLVGTRLPVHAADPHPGAPAATTAALLHPGRGLLLHLSDTPPPPTPTGGATATDSAADGGGVARWRDRVDEAALRPRPGGALAGVGGLLVRPDGYVAWAASSPPGPGAPRGALEGALRTWFGAPR